MTIIKFKSNLPKIVMNMYTLCYKKCGVSNRWLCESGYRTVKEVDDRTNELMKEKVFCTTFFPFFKYTHTFYKRYILHTI